MTDSSPSNTPSWGKTEEFLSSLGFEILHVVKNDEIEKPPLYKKYIEAESIEIAPKGSNGQGSLTIFIVSNSRAQASAAFALDIEGGALDDPPKISGCAHLTEHMLFTGSDEFPDLEDFRNFVSYDNGDTNAWTADQKTSFHFCVRQRSFPGAITRLSSAFFLSKFQTDRIEQEIQAVNNELEGQIDELGFHFQQIMKACANPKHPYYRNFCCGSSTTLGGIEKSSLRNALVQFHRDIYLGRRKFAAMVSSSTISSVQQRVLRVMCSRWRTALDDPKAPLQNFSLPVKERNIEKAFRPKKETPKWVQILQPSLDNGSWDTALITFSFAFDSKSPTFAQELMVLGKLLNWEDCQTLKSYLLDSHLALSFNAGLGFAGFGQRFFDIDIEITAPKDLDELKNVILEIGRAIYGYLQLLIITDFGGESSLLEELQKQNRVELELRNCPASTSLAKIIAGDLSSFPPEKVLLGGSDLTWDIEVYRKLVKTMQASRNLLIFSTSAVFQEVFKKNNKSNFHHRILVEKEEIYGNTFVRADFEKEWLRAWTPAAAPSDKFKLPSANPLLPTQFAFKRTDTAFTIAPPDTTALLTGNQIPSNIDVVYQQLPKLIDTPTVQASIRFMLPFLRVAPSDSEKFYRTGSIAGRQLNLEDLSSSGPILRGVVAAVLVGAVNEKLRLLAYQAEAAGMQFEMTVISSGGEDLALQFDVMGVSETAEIVFREIFNQFLGTVLTLSDIEDSHEALRKLWQSAIDNISVLDQTKECYKLQMLPNQTSSRDCLKALQEAVPPIIFHHFFENGISQISDIFKRCQVFAAFSGNVNKADLVSTWIQETIVDGLKNHGVDFIGNGSSIEKLKTASLSFSKSKIKPFLLREGSKIRLRRSSIPEELVQSAQPLLSKGKESIEQFKARISLEKTSSGALGDKEDGGGGGESSSIEDLENAKKRKGFVESLGSMKPLPISILAGADPEDLEGIQKLLHNQQKSVAEKLETGDQAVPLTGNLKVERTTSIVGPPPHSPSSLERGELSDNERSSSQDLTILKSPKAPRPLSSHSSSLTSAEFRSEPKVGAPPPPQSPPQGATFAKLAAAEPPELMTAFSDPLIRSSSISTHGDTRAIPIGGDFGVPRSGTVEVATSHLMKDIEGFRIRFLDLSKASDLIIKTYVDSPEGSKLELKKAKSKALSDSGGLLGDALLPTVLESEEAVSGFPLFGEFKALQIAENNKGSSRWLYVAASTNDESFGVGGVRVTIPIEGVASIGKIAEINLLSNLIETAFFTQLRTKEGLAYYLGLEIVEIRQQPAISFALESKTDPALALKSVLTFISSINSEVLNKMSISEYDGRRQSLACSYLGTGNSINFYHNKITNKFFKGSIDMTTNKKLADYLMNSDNISDFEQFKRITQRFLTKQPFIINVIFPKSDFPTLPFTPPSIQDEDGKEELSLKKSLSITSHDLPPTVSDFPSFLKGTDVFPAWKVEEPNTTWFLMREPRSFHAWAYKSGRESELYLGV